MEDNVLIKLKGTSEVRQLNIITESEIREVISDAVEKSLSRLMPNKGRAEEYLTREEAADLLKVSKGTIDVWRRKGIIKAYRINSRVRFLKSDLYKAVK